MSFVIAIDGPAAAGKGTISRAVAQKFGLAHLDTGLLYRAVGKRVLAGDEAITAARSLRPEDLKGDDLRRSEVAQAASRVAAIPQVRAALVDFQREFAQRTGGAVLDGRDIGTVICPDADVKLFVTASAEARAARRHAEDVLARPDLTFDEVLADVKARDDRDMNRADAPLRAAGDAVTIDTTQLDVAEAIATAVQAINARRGSV